MPQKSRLTLGRHCPHVVHLGMQNEKGNLQTMRLRNIPEAKDIVRSSPFVIQDPEARKGSWKQDPSRPLHIEIGTGKGRFIIEMASRHPENDYLGIERYESVLMRACQKMSGIPYATPADQREHNENPEKDDNFTAPKNLYFLSCDAKLLPDIFESGEVDKIYLNFSDPWPKARHAKRRLTSREFLTVYEQVLSVGGLLEFKTDNVGLFDFSLEEIKEAPHWELLVETHNLHRDPVLNEGNIMTEYERKFSTLGNKICKLTARYLGPDAENSSGSDSI